MEPFPFPGGILMLSQESQKGMAEQKAPIAATQQLVSFCDAINL
jgi:hypothetical protein